MKDFIILTDSCCDLPDEMLIKLNIHYLGLVCNLDGKEFVEDSGKTLSYKKFYDSIRNGSMPTTSQVNSYRFYEEFEQAVKNNLPVLYVGFSSVLSGTYNSASIAREEILEQYPEADISVVDSRSASMGHGLLVYYAAKLREEGKSKDEVVQWLEDNKLKLCHVFTVDDLQHLKRGGRVSPTAAAIGSLLNIKPVLYVNNDGELKNFSKAKGSKRAIKMLFEKLEEHIVNPEEQVIFICHSDYLEGAEDLAKMIKDKYKVKDIVINYIGTVIGSHTGAGTIGVFFLGDTREP
jgi:DegV family protein with EDD domain